MDALVMCGGRGRRLDADREKPLVPVGDVPMIDRVIRTLDDSSVEGIYIVPSKETTHTRDHVSVPCIETPGDGYVADLATALADDRVSEPVLTVAADLPLLTGDVVDDVLTEYQGGSLTVAVPVALKEQLGVSVDEWFEHGGDRVAPTGLNVVGSGPDRTVVRRDRHLAVNVNRPRDREIADRLADQTAD